MHDATIKCPFEEVIKLNTLEIILNPQESLLIVFVNTILCNLEFARFYGD